METVEPKSRTHRRSCQIPARDLENELASTISACLLGRPDAASAITEIEAVERPSTWPRLSPFAVASDDASRVGEMQRSLQLEKFQQQIADALWLVNAGPSESNARDR